MKFVLIPAGEFDMGSLTDEEGRHENEEPVHHVTISKPFYLGIYPVTQREWKAVMKENPSKFKGDNLPVEQVSMNDVKTFINNLNKKEGTNKYRLPSEAEWECAVRAGTTTKYSYGDDESKLSKYAWYAENSSSKTQEVGQKQPNKWQLFDMHGNVWEWVQDSWYDDYQGAPEDGTAWEYGGGTYRALRGGSWNCHARDCRSANRGRDKSSACNNDLSFRLLRDL